MLSEPQFALTVILETPSLKPITLQLVSFELPSYMLPKIWVRFSPEVIFIV